MALAALLGKSPEELPQLLPAPLPRLPASLPPNLSLDLIARRPDITASRWRVEAARENLVTARAEYYPDVSITALAGLSSMQIGRLLEGGSAVPAITAAIHLPLFDSGLRSARSTHAQAQIVAAVASYQETVVAAANDVATAA